jgi:hypothetical protein
VSPTVRMPDAERARALALRAELIDALCVARCSAQLAGFESVDFVVRELLLTVMQQIDRAADIIRRSPLPNR